MLQYNSGMMALHKDLNFNFFSTITLLNVTGWKPVYPVQRQVKFHHVLKHKTYFRLVMLSRIASCCSCGHTTTPYSYEYTLRKFQTPMVALLYFYKENQQLRRTANYTLAKVVLHCHMNLHCVPSPPSRRFDRVWPD